MSKIRAKTATADGSLADMTPKQLKEAASMMRKSTPNALRRKNPAMKDMSDTEIKAMIDQMEAMATDPELRRQVQEQQAATSNSGLDPREMSKLRNKKPDDMTPEELHKMIKLQRDMLNTNPDMFWKNMEQNPQYANMPRAEVEKSIRQMADMSPEELHQYFTMQKSIGPMVGFMQKMEIASGGTARYVVITIIALFVYWVIRKIFFRV